MIKRYVVLCLFLMTSHALAETGLTDAEAVNIAGRQRMLTQRVIKAYCQIGLGVIPDQSRTQLTGAAELFEQQTSALENFTTDTSILRELSVVQEKWMPFRAAVTGSVDKSRAQQLAQDSDELLEMAHGVVEMLEESSSTEYARLVNVAGRQRMLSQRAAKLYLLKAWGVDNPNLQNDLKQTRDEFAAALKQLQSSAANTRSISQRLQQVSDLWVSFSSALNIEGSTTFPLIVADASEEILQHFEEITFLYEKLSDQ